MNCPYCGHLETKVLDSRDSEEAEKTRRRRECEHCGKRFTTYERVELVELWVVKKDGRREKFDRAKIFHGLERACEKRPVTRPQIEEAVDGIERDLRLKETTDVPSTVVGEMVMEHLRRLDKVAYIRFASVYHEFQDLESFERELDSLKVVGEDEGEGKGAKDSTDLALMVSTATEGMSYKWDKSRIAKALVSEAKMAEADADDVAKAVEKKVAASGIKTISVSLLRELVNNELFVRGLDKKLAKQEIIGMSTFNLEQFIFAKSKDNSNVIANNPEAVNLAIAENTLKQYALKEVYSKDVADAYLSGAIHIHNMGYITRVYCSAHSIDYIKKYGLKLDNLSTASGPAHHAATLTGHLNTFLASMQAYYAGALGLGYVNIFYAPLLVGKTFHEMKQQAQYLIFSCSQNAFSRGGQSLVPDETIWVKEKGALKQVKIGELVDNQLVRAPSFEQWRDGTQLSRSNLQGIEAVCFDDEGKISTQAITAFARIPFSGKIYSFETGNGIVKGVTGSHSVFVWDGAQFAAKKAEELHEGDYVIAAKNTGILAGNEEELDAAGFYLARAEGENDVRVLDGENEFGKALAEKYGTGFYKEYEKETGVKAECVRSNWLRYKKIPLKRFVSAGCSLEGKTLLYKGDSQSGIPAKFKESKAFAKLTGYFASEGHDNEKRKTFAAISNKDENFVQRVVQCVQALGCDAVVAKNSRTGVFTVALHGMLGKLVSDLCEDEKGVKQVPEALYSAPKALQESFLEAFFEGDGLKSRKNFAVASTSENVVNGIAMLLAMQGKSSHVYLNNHGSQKPQLLNSAKSSSNLLGATPGGFRSGTRSRGRQPVVVHRREYENENWKPIFELREEDAQTRVIDHKLGKKMPGNHRLHVEAAMLAKDLQAQSELNENGFGTVQLSKIKMLLEADVCFSRIRKIETREYDGFVYDVSVPPKESFLGGTGLLFFHNTLFIDFNIYLGVPDYLREVPAIGPGGKYQWKHADGGIEELDEVERGKDNKLIQPKEGRILTYKDFEREAQMFAKAMFDVWRTGDAYGVPFPFPKNDLHVDEAVFKDPVQTELLKYACTIASENGNPYFVFDRGAATLSQCCRLRTKLDETMIQRTELLRFCGFQNVTVNLPQAAYKAGAGNAEGAVKDVLKNMDLCMKAHLQKKGFIKKLMSPGSPCWQIGQEAADGTGPYVDLEKSTYIIGMIGLNECVKHLTGGGQLHDSPEAYKLGLKIISAMYLKAAELSKETGLKVVLEETPAEGASLRFAKIDLQRFPDAKNYVRGNQETGEVYYTNSVHLVADAPVSITERIEKQGKFSNLIDAGSITHVFLGEQRPDPGAILSVVKKTWQHTNAAQITIAPEFTVCNDCHKVSMGYKRENLVPVEAEKKPVSIASLS